MFLIYILSLIFVANLILGGLVLFKNTQKPVNQSFSFFVFSVTGWNLSILLILLAENIFMGKFAFFFATLIFGSLLWFSIVFPKNKRLKPHQYLIFIPTLIFAIFSFIDNLYFQGINVINNGIKTERGILYPFFISYITVYLSFALYILIKKYLKSISKERLQFKYIFLGAILFVFFATFTNAVLPALKIHQFNGLGPSFSIIMIIFTTYAIVRHHLMDIKVIIRLGTIYLTLFGAVSFIFVFLISLLGIYIGHYLSHFVASLLIVVGFIPLKNLIENLTDNIFFRKRIKTEDIISRLNGIIHSSFANLDQLLDNFNRLIVECIRTERAAILILIPKGNFVSRQLIDENVKELKMNPDNPIINFFKNNPLNPIIDKEILNNDSAYQDIVFELEKLNFSLAVPIKVKGKLIGVYFIGPKKSQDSFTKEDVGLLELLAMESAFAIDNARLFEEFKKIDETKSKFITVVSHQLRTPLTSLLWNIEMITKKETDEKTKKELFDCIYENAIFINSHIDDMLIALELDGSKKQEFPLVEKNNFEEALEKILQMMAPEFKKKNISVKAEKLDDIPQFLFNRRKIEKSLIILLRNAVMYSPENGEIKIKLERKEINNNPYLVFSVKDRGVGITDDEKSKIFSKFYRSGEAQKISPNGFGLDLFIVKNFIEAHNGEIWFDSEGRDKGAAFSFSLPLE